MYRVIDLTGARPIRSESLGSKEKHWLLPAAACGLNDDQHLFKVGRDGSGENWSERVTCELASALGLPTALYDLATFNGSAASAGRFWQVAAAPRAN